MVAALSLAAALVKEDRRQRHAGRGRVTVVPPDDMVLSIPASPNKKKGKKGDGKGEKGGGGWTTYNLLAGVDSIDAECQRIILLDILVGNLERGRFKAWRKDKHVLELSFLHILGEPDDKDGRDLLGGASTDIAVAVRGRVVVESVAKEAGAAIVAAMEALCSQGETTETTGEAANMDAVGKVVAIVGQALWDAGAEIVRETKGIRDAVSHCSR